METEYSVQCVQWREQFRLGFRMLEGGNKWLQKRPPRRRWGLAAQPAALGLGARVRLRMRRRRRRLPQPAVALEYEVPWVSGDVPLGGELRRRGGGRVCALAVHARERGAAASRPATCCFA
jgi:hypothetical protein